jgi:prophage antirepressor-like protein
MVYQVNSLSTIVKDDVIFRVQYILVKDEPWFKAKAIATILGYANTMKAIIDNVDSEDKQTLNQIVTNSEHNSELCLPGNSRNTIFINESGLYSLILRSQKEEAKQFKRWITSEVLPSIRKTGKYALQEQIPPPPPPSPLDDVDFFDMDKIRDDNTIVLTTENQLHFKVVDYIRKYFDHAMRMSSLGEFQDTVDKRIEGKMKGYQKGACDLMITNKHIKYQGMCIELKTPKGTGHLSSSQENWLKEMLLNCHYVIVSDDYDEICYEIATYFEGARFVCPYCLRKRQYFRTKESLDKHLTLFHWNHKNMLKHC